MANARGGGGRDEALPEGALGSRREVTIEALMEHFANDEMEVEEFERRVEAAHKASSADELRTLLADLPGADLPARRGERTPDAPGARGFRVTSAAHVKEQEFVVAIWGGATRKGRWSPARTNWALGLMGGAELDLREAVLGPGVTEIRAVALMGGVDIVVPPGMRVESHGLALMGGFDHAEEVDADFDEDAPVVRITGAALMGGVSVSFRYPGESAGEARKRRRLERREKRRLRDGR